MNLVDSSGWLEYLGGGPRAGIPTADSIILATAWRHEALLWTTDAHFKGLRGVRYFSK